MNKKIIIIVAIIIICVISAPFIFYNVLFGGSLYSGYLQNYSASKKCQKLNWQEILPENIYSFRDGDKYNMIIEVSISDKKIYADFWQPEECYLDRNFDIKIKKDSEIILHDTYSGGLNANISSGNYKVNFADLAKQVSEGYRIAESNGILYIYQNLFYDKSPKSVGFPRTNKIILSTDEGKNWYLLNPLSRKAEDNYLFRTDDFSKKIIKIEPMFGNFDYLKITFSNTHSTVDKYYEFNFKKINNQYEIE